MDIKLLSVLHFVSLFFTIQAKSLEKVIVLNRPHLQRLKYIQASIQHVIQKRDEQTAVLSEKVGDLETSATFSNDDASQYLQSSIGDGKNAFENQPAGETLNDIRNLGDDYSAKLGNLQDEVSMNLDNAGEEATRNIEKIGNEVNKQVEKYGKEAMDTLHNFKEEYGEKLNEFGKNFEGTANDISNFANKKGQESIDDAQQWFKDK